MVTVIIPQKQPLTKTWSVKLRSIIVKICSKTVKSFDVLFETKNLIIKFKCTSVEIIKKNL